MDKPACPATARTGECPNEFGNFHQSAPDETAEWRAGINYVCADLLHLADGRVVRRIAYHLKDEGRTSPFAMPPFDARLRASGCGERGAELEDLHKYLEGTVYPLAARKGLPHSDLASLKRWIGRIRDDASWFPAEDAEAVVDFHPHATEQRATGQMSLF